MNLSEALSDWTPENYVYGIFWNGKKGYCALGWIAHKFGVDHSLLGQCYGGPSLLTLTGIHSPRLFFAIQHLSDHGGETPHDRINAVKNYVQKHGV